MTIEGLVESRGGSRLADPGKPRIAAEDTAQYAGKGRAISMPKWATATPRRGAGIDLDFKDSYCQFNVMHLKPGRTYPLTVPWEFGATGTVWPCLGGLGRRHRSQPGSTSW